MIRSTSGRYASYWNSFLFFNEDATVRIKHLTESVKVHVSMDSSSSHFLSEMTQRIEKLTGQTSFGMPKLRAERNRKGFPSICIHSHTLRRD